MAEVLKKRGQTLWGIMQWGYQENGFLEYTFFREGIYPTKGFLKDYTKYLHNPYLNTFKQNEVMFKHVSNFLSRIFSIVIVVIIAVLLLAMLLISPLSLILRPDIPDIELLSIFKRKKKLRQQ